MKKLYWPLLALVLISVGYACATAEAEAGPEILFVEVWQDADSTWFAFEWFPRTPRAGAKPLAYWETRLQDATTGQILATGVSPASIHNDSLAVPPDYPLAGDSVMLQVGALAIDIDGNAAQRDDGSEGWGMSLPFPFFRGIVYPSPVDSVRLILDTIPGVIALHIRPQFAYIQIDQTVMFCALLEYDDGSSKYSVWGQSISEPTPWRLTPAAAAYCQGVLERWRAERLL